MSGQRWLSASLGDHEPARVRRPWAIGWLFVAHTLDVAELYVRLRERERAGAVQLVSFDAEPASWHQSAAGLLKPDAYAVWIEDGWELHRWIEVDRATESLPTVRRQLLGYIDTANGGDLGPRDVLPRVVVTVPSVARQRAVAEVIKGLPAPGSKLIHAELFTDVLAMQSSAVDAARPPS